jgi:thiol-disulfide isomerase/thioredoxin
MSGVAPTEWKEQTYAAGDKKFHNYQGNGVIEINLGGKVVPASFGFYIFDPSDANRQAIAHSLFYYADYACQGTLKLGGKTYNVLLDDLRSSGSFAAPKDPGPPELLLIDRAGNGRYNLQADQFDVKKPFNIGGTTYEIQELAADGSSLQIRKSSQTVAEVPLPPAEGGKAREFSATTTDGKAVNFPSDYKGKLVLLDFWATWCGPCMGEVPSVVAVYNKYHGQGFEILGISLDNKSTASKVAPVTKEKGMAWPQVCDQKFWEAAVAKLYGIDSIPHAYLVDGDTGLILAEGDGIRGEGLARAVEAALAKKHPGR